MAMIDGLLQELEQEAKTTRRVLERVPERSAGMETAQEGAHARRTGAARGGHARARSPRSPHSRRFRLPTSKIPFRQSASELIPALDESIADREAAAGRNGRCDAQCDVADEAERTGSDRDAARGAAAIDHAEPLVSPSRSAVGVPARARRGDSVDLRSERRRESVRAVTLLHEVSRACARPSDRACGLDWSGIPWRYPGLIMRKLLLLLLATSVLLSASPFAQQPSSPAETRLVLLIAVDQFRYDYLTRFRSDYTAGFAQAAHERSGLHQRLPRALPDRHGCRPCHDAVGCHAVGERHYWQRLVRSRVRDIGCKHHRRDRQAGGRTRRGESLTSTPPGRARWATR